MTEFSATPVHTSYGTRIPYTFTRATSVFLFLSLARYIIINVPASEARRAD